MIDSTDWLAFLHDWRKSCRGARVALCMLIINVWINLTIQQSLLSHKLENRLRWVAFGSNLDPVVAASNPPIRSPVVILAPPKVFRLFLDRLKNLSDTIRSTFNSAAEQSCSGTKIVPELAFPVWTGALSNTHFATFRVTVRYSVSGLAPVTVHMAFSLPMGNYERRVTRCTTPGNQSYLGKFSPWLMQLVTEFSPWLMQELSLGKNSLAHAHY